MCPWRHATDSSFALLSKDEHTSSECSPSVSLLPPRTFTRCVAAALAPLQARGLRILPYLDDWLVCAQSRDQALRDTSILLDHVSRLGLAVNFAKSSLIPSRQVIFIGIAINSVTMKASVLKLVSHVQGSRKVSFGVLLQLMGKLTSVSTVIFVQTTHLQSTT